MKKIFRIASYIMVGISLSLLGYVAASPGFMRCLFLPLYDVQAIAHNIYVNPEMTQAERQQLLTAYQQATRRVKAFFGGLTAQPVLIAGNSQEIIQQFGNAQAQTGMTHLSPVATYIVLDAQGTNVDVISHELCHAELMARTGWLNRIQQIPVWFDEGLAMLIDYRFPNAEEEWRIMTIGGQHAPPLSSLEQRQHFFAGNNVYLHYLTARHEVSRWYEKTGDQGLQNFLKCIAQGSSFEECYTGPLPKPPQSPLP